MSNSNTDRQHQRALTALLGKGVAVIGFGAACLVAPSFLEPSSATASVAAVLRMTGWLCSGVGVALLGFRFCVQSKAKQLSALPRRKASASAASYGHGVLGTEASPTGRGFPMASGPAPTLETKMQAQADRRLQS